MDEIRVLIDRATGARAAEAEKSRAFGQIVRRFQDLAFGCAYAVLQDVSLAEDAAQESFIAAWRNLHQLREPQAFPGWFKRIVLSQCGRMTRGMRPDLVPLDAVAGLAAAGAGTDPHALLEREELRAEVQAALLTLGENERLATTLFYVNDFSLAEIAAFLEVPVSTIKKRLFSARKRLRERMLDMVRDTLREARPSNDDQFARTVEAFNQALDSFVNKVKQDRNVLAAILYGSLSHDQVWAKSDIDVMLIGRDEKKGEKHFALIENGVNIHASLIPRSKFRRQLEGALQGSFFHSSFSKSTLLYSTDDSIRAYYADARHVGARDREMQILAEGSPVLYTLAKAEKWFYLKNDLTYSFLWIMYSVNILAKIETLLAGEVTGREVLHQALKHNPAFFNAVYTDLVHNKKDRAAIEVALRRINTYLDERLHVLFKPVLDYLATEGGVRSTTELDDHFAKRAQIETLCFAYEWLADKGVIQKVPSPVRLTEKSLVALDEAAYYYDPQEGKAK